MSQHQEQSDPHFTVFIRLPFPRGDFVDPPPVDWNSSKDQALWDILSRPSKGNDIDWKSLAENFDVTLPFLLQQAAWLYNRQLSQVRAQMRKVGKTHSTSPSPAPPSVSGSTAIGGQAMKRAGSGGLRAPSSISVRQKERPGSRNESSAPPTPLRPNAPIPRPPSNNPQAGRAQSPRKPTPVSQPKGTQAGGKRVTSHKREPAEVAQPTESPPPEDEYSFGLSSSSSDSDSDAPNRRGPGTRRFGKFSVHKPSTSVEDDEDESPAFLPMDTKHTTEDPSATLRVSTGLSHPQRHHPSEPLATRAHCTTESSTSSTSSGVAIDPPRDDKNRATRAERGTLSPRRAAEVSRLSPWRRANGKEGSDGTPSMGSSFSDLDDASVTQSALEEALLSNMQHGGVASRMSTISQALKSRYL